jgi:hypothetical protein
MYRFIGDAVDMCYGISHIFRLHVLFQSLPQFVMSARTWIPSPQFSVFGVFTESHRFQASKFVQRFHQERKTKLSLILDSERWKQADVPDEFQRLVTHIIDTGKLCHLSF